MSYEISKDRKIPTPREALKDDCELFRGWGNKWSEWIKVMSPIRIDGWERRNGVGYKLQRHLVTQIFDKEKGKVCGIYEFKAEIRRTRLVVYVGCTCRNNFNQSLPARINEYCADGSHLGGLINDALRKMYTIYFRYRTADDMRIAVQDEKDLLANYSYGWNTMTVTGTLPDVRLT